MNPTDPKNYLWANIETLMGGGRQTVDAVQARIKASRGTVQRIKAGETSVGTDLLLTIADAFGIGIWELLRPDLGKEAHQAQTSSPSLPEALETLANALAAADPATRDLAAGMLANLAKNPENHPRVALGLQAMLRDVSTPSS